MLLPRVVPLLVAVLGARFATAGDASHVAETLSKLEALVGSMAEGQESLTSRPEPVATAAHPLGATEGCKPGPDPDPQNKFD